MSIYDAAVSAFVSSAEVLESLQARRVNVLAEISNAIGNRPKFPLQSGYNGISPNVGCCLDNGARGEIFVADVENSIELRANDADWLTIEAILADLNESDYCYFEVGVATETTLVADVFIREIFPDGVVKDSGHQECHISGGTLSVFRLELPKGSKDADARAVIHLRHPPQRLVVDRLALTLV